MTSEHRWHQGSERFRMLCSYMIRRWTESLHACGDCIDTKANDERSMKMGRFLFLPWSNSGHGQRPRFQSNLAANEQVQCQSMALAGTLINCRPDRVLLTSKGAAKSRGGGVGSHGGGEQKRMPRPTIASKALSCN